jgi:hypothetical protein
MHLLCQIVARAPKILATYLRAKPDLLKQFDLICSSVQPLSEKYFCFLQRQITGVFCVIPCPLRGALAIVTNVGRGLRWTRQRRRARWMQGRLWLVSIQPACRRTAQLRTAKPCGPGTRCWCQVGGGATGPTGFCCAIQSAGDGDKTNSSPGRARNKPLKPLRREGRLFTAEPVCSCAFLLAQTLHMRPRVQRAPGFPCALCFLMARMVLVELGRSAPRGCGSVSSHHHPPSDPTQRVPASPIDRVRYR